MTRDDINRLYEDRSSIADFLIAIGVVKVDEPESLKPKIERALGGAGCGPRYIQDRLRREGLKIVAMT